jgi:8-oxo-dGTP pyrophosphatase MutT (NUDIX family)
MTDAAIPAATLIVVRPSDVRPPELLMVERAGGMAFAAGAWVFPGGRIDEADRAGVDDGALVAAVRETIEETGIPAGIAPVPDRQTALALQRELLAGAGLGSVLERRGLKIDAPALTRFARWVPKFHAVRRFDTMFFLARCPPGEWHPNVVAGECADARWLTAREVLDRDARGEARLIFPTRRNLERLAQHNSFDAIRADALAHPVEAVTPWVEERDGERFITIPGHLGYPVTQEKLDGLWRG